MKTARYRRQKNASFTPLVFAHSVPAVPSSSKVRRDKATLITEKNLRREHRLHSQPDQFCSSEKIQLFVFQVHG